MDSPMDTGSVDLAEERRQFVTPRRLSQLLLHPPSFFSATGGCATTGTSGRDNTQCLGADEDRNHSTALLNVARCSPGADSKLVELLQSRVAALESDKRQLLEQVVTLKHSVSTAAHDRDIHCREMQSKYEAALTHIQDCGQIELQQANRCSQELAIQLQSVCNEREEAEKTWLARERQLKEHYESQVSVIAERLKLCEDERAILRERIDEVSLELKDQQQQLNDDLQIKTKEMSALQERLDHTNHKLSQFQQYVGATDLPSNSRGPNLYQEKTALQQKVQELQRENQLLITEAELVRVRSESLAQILNIQEVELAKHCSQEEAEPLGPNQLHTLLSRWRTKVFELLVKLKTSETEQHRIQHSCQQQIAAAMSDVERITREKEVLSLAKKAESAEKLLLRQKLDDSQLTVKQNAAVIDQFRDKLSGQSALLARIADQMRQIDSLPNQMENFACNVVKPHLLELETRIGRACGRAQTLNACLSSQGAVWLSQQTPKNTADQCVQTDSKNDSSASSQTTVTELTRLSHPRLVQECSALESERDRLVRRLNQASQSFHQKLESMKKSHAEKLLVMQSRIDRLTQENQTSADQLSSAVQCMHQEKEQREALAARCSQLEEVIREMEASCEQRLQLSLEEESEKAREGFTKMESLLEVARREQAKTAVQLQHLQQQAERDKERAVEAVELSKAQVEHELDVCRKKLHSVQVERNLLMTTLRQEGIARGSDQPRSIRSSSTVKLRVEEEDEAVTETFTADKENIEATPSHNTVLCGREKKPANSHCADETQAMSSQDMQQVLLDLHQLSSTLLNIDT